MSGVNYENKENLSFVPIVNHWSENQLFAFPSSLFCKYCLLFSVFAEAQKTSLNMTGTQYKVVHKACMDPRDFNIEWETENI